MRKVREVLRYRFDSKMSLDRIASALNMSKGCVHNIVERFSTSGLQWPLDESLTDTMLEERLYGTASNSGEPELDLDYISKEIARPFVTMELLWREYHDTHLEGISRATFFRKARVAVSPEVNLKMMYKGGDLLFIDYSGDSLFYIDCSTRKRVDVELFVSCWGASSYAFAEVTLTQRAVDFCYSHVRAFDRFKCVPHGLVPDNLKSGVKKANRYEPKINPLYEYLAEHYGVAILPARVKEPKDKAIVESAVGFVQRYILGRLRNRTFFSLQEINAAIAELLVQLNNEPMQGYGGKSRLQRFEELDRPNAQPLPVERFAITDVKYDVSVAPNYHIRYDEHYYSIPHDLARQKVDVYLVGSTLEIYYDGVHLCRHLKQPPNFAYTTIDEHMPPHHRFVRGWSSEWFIDRAGKIGIATAEVAALIMKRHRHPQQGFNSVMGLLNLAKGYTAERLEQASRRALRFRCATYQSVKSILEQNLDKEKDGPNTLVHTISEHENLRGPEYFNSQKQSNE